MGLLGKGLGLAATFLTGNPAFLLSDKPSDLLKNAIGFESLGIPLAGQDVGKIISGGLLQGGGGGQQQSAPPLPPQQVLRAQPNLPKRQGFNPASGQGFNNPVMDILLKNLRNNNGGIFFNGNF